MVLMMAALGSPSGFAGEPVVVPANQVVADALAHSLQIKSADQEVEAAEARRVQARAAGLPLLNVEGRATTYDGLEDSVMGPGNVIAAIEDRYSVAASVTQPLFTGGRIAGQKDSARFWRFAAVQARRGTEADVALQALTAYWGWSKAHYAAEALRASVLRMEAHATDMQHLHEAGLATDNDQLATDVQLEQTRLLLEEALRAVDVARADLAFLTGSNLPADGVPDRAAVPGDQPVAPESDLIDQALTNRPERAARLYEAESAEAATRASRSELFPQVALAARYEQANPNLLNFPPEEKWQEDMFAGVTLTWNLLDWGLARSKAAEAAARARQADLRAQLVEDQVALEVRDARAALQNALSRVKVARRAEQSAGRNLEAATDQWQAGLARHAEVLDAHDRLTQAQNATVAACADVCLARAALDHAVGRLKAGDYYAND